MSEHTPIIDQLFLELSTVSTAKTKRDIKQQAELATLRAQVERYENVLRCLFDEGPIPEGFGLLEKDCYEYASDIAGGEEPTKEQDFEGWLRMIEDYKNALAATGKEV